MSESLLCEQCGYTIDGLPESGPCPECGTPIAASLPSARPGTPWQRSAEFANVIRSLAQTVLHPRRTFSLVMIDLVRSRGLLIRALTASSLLMSLALLPLTGYHRVLSDPASLWPGRVAMIALGAFASFVLLYALTWIEISGVKYFGRQRAWRVTQAVAVTVCAHASVGWLLGAVGIAAVSVRWSVNWAPDTSFLRRLSGLLEYWQWLPAVAGALLIGMLVFESLVYVGIRRCRFANPPRA